MLEAWGGKTFQIKVDRDGIEVLVKKDQFPNQNLIVFVNE